MLQIPKHIASLQWSSINGIIEVAKKSSADSHLKMGFTPTTFRSSKLIIDDHSSSHSFFTVFDYWWYCNSTLYDLVALHVRGLWAFLSVSSADQFTRSLECFSLWQEKPPGTVDFHHSPIWSRRRMRNLGVEFLATSVCERRSSLWFPNPLRTPPSEGLTPRRPRPPLRGLEGQRCPVPFSTPYHAPRALKRK